MARPIEFDREKTLQDAMQLFWRKGYHKTSVRDLTEATRLQPGSLYGAFSNKRSLFLNSLDYYAEELKQFVDSVLNSDEPPLVRIRLFFEHLLDETAADPEGKGCLLVNTLLEVPAEDEEISQRVIQALGYVEQRFRQVLTEALEQGELASGKDPSTLARLLMTGIFGLRVYNKMQPQREELNDIVDSLLSVVNA
ncbi:MAG: TetR/AcrR family transcriptional regulator [gamma proteobacterium endosymbiont of Lamellibrachia anaximandri]|nr:TetR/AcrR family transcriptional regulator [gamma proteobacterium endosymbiont of Lamellibrachia anaximandri]MBL3535013.1 TetR/AcrR family transcriptional regulator [gamma proteobacterium endosymbiont of Lamellibrachia anaximandri]